MSTTGEARPRLNVRTEKSVDGGTRTLHFTGERTAMMNKGNCAA
jgi:hypothetical protein